MNKIQSHRYRHGGLSSSITFCWLLTTHLERKRGGFGLPLRHVGNGSITMTTLLCTGVLANTLGLKIGFTSPDEQDPPICELGDDTYHRYYW